MQDAELVREYQRSGDAGLFRQLVERYQDRVFRLVCSVLGPYLDADAEEVAQEVFLQIFRRLGGFRGESSFGTWVYRIAYNRALDRRALARFQVPHLPDTVLAAMAAPHDDPLHAAIGADDRRQLMGAIESLPDLYRTIVSLYYWLDSSLDDIAVYTGVPAGTVKSYLARARQQIRRKLET